MRRYSGPGQSNQRLSSGYVRRWNCRVTQNPVADGTTGCRVQLRLHGAERDRIVAERISTCLANHPKYENPPIPEGPLSALAGQWQATLTFDRGSAQHTLVFEQNDKELVGTHHGEFVSGDLTGSVTANQVHFRSSQRIEGQLLSYEFAGTVSGDTMEGTLNMGEYGMAKWTAERHLYKSPYGAPKGSKKG